MSDRAAPFREAVERGDHAAILATMAPDVVFRSPVRFHPYVGREAVSRVFRILLDTVDHYELTDELESDEQVGLVFKSLFDDRDVEGIHLLRFDEQGLIREYTEMARPMSGVAAMFEVLAPKIRAAEEAASAVAP